MPLNPFRPGVLQPITTIGIDILHLPRLRRLLFRASSRCTHNPLPTDQATNAIPNRKFNSKLARFAHRILSPKELEQFHSLFSDENGIRAPQEQELSEKEDGVEEDRVLRFLGNRWAVKEAVYKAYPHPHPSYVRPKYTPGRLTWKDVTLSKDVLSGKPLVNIVRTRAWDVKQVKEEEDVNNSAHVSITHDGEYVVAVVLYSYFPASPGIGMIREEWVETVKGIVRSVEEIMEALKGKFQ
ncbi:4'-phosphopantetheinyl transferase superfamily-domain-containing protein [Kalaharituber pfeilii]|nr:4'-phosphopantetheinyl transferase superfamily-domain-containing protein [Kalaharituber pfeilii]